MKVGIEIPEGYEVKTQTLKHFEGFEAIVIELKKIQPRRRVILEQTDEINPAYNCAVETGIIVQNSEFIWKQVKETDFPLTKEEPKLILGVAEAMQLWNHHPTYDVNLSRKIHEFIKEK